MKPLSPNWNNRRDTNRLFPSAECHYHGPRFFDYGSRCAGTARASFVAISRNYFNREARKGFALEAAAFALITITTAPAFLDCSRALFEFIRVVGM